MIDMPRVKKKTKSALLCCRFPEVFLQKLDYYLEQSPYMNRADFTRAAVFEKIRRDAPQFFEALMPGGQDRDLTPT